MQHMGERLRQLRRARNLTQEEVAQSLKVSCQAISKWERGEGWPDIAMLPALARFFDVTTDALLGMNTREYDEANALWERQNQQGLHAQNAELMRHMLRTHPGDALLLVQLSTSLEKLGGEKNLRESIAAQETILTLNSNADVRSAVQYNICHSWWKLGDHARAISLAKQLPTLYKTRENALIYFTTGRDREQLARAALQPLAWSVGTQLNALWEETGDPTHLQKALDVIALLMAPPLPPLIQQLQERLRSALEASARS